MLYTYNGILLRLKKEGNSDACYNMEERQRHDAKLNKQDTQDKYRVVLLILGTETNS